MTTEWTELARQFQVEAALLAEIAARQREALALLRQTVAEFEATQDERQGGVEQ